MNRLAPVKYYSLGSLLWLCLTGIVSGQAPSNWRGFNSANGLTESAVNSVTIGPRGTVWLKHDDVAMFTRFDGYQFSTLPIPSTTPSRIEEGKSTQAWAIGNGSVLELSGGNWVVHPLPQIQAEYRRNIRRVTQPISLIPLRINNVLILLSDQLIRFDSMRGIVTTMKRASDLNIGEFRDMIATQDQSIFVTGSDGIARALASPRSLSPNSEWQPISPPPSTPLREFQRPTENLDGSITLVAIGADQNRTIATLKDESWQTTDFGTAKLRIAWTGNDVEFWGSSYNALYRVDSTQVTPVDQNEISAGLLYDIAVEAPDTFFVATSDGLLRHAPSCWRRPLPVKDIDSAIHGIHQDKDHHLWFLNTEGLIAMDGSRWQRHSWPNDQELLFSPTDTIHQLTADEILFSSRGTYYTFNTRTATLEEFQPSDSTQIIRILGQTNDNELVVLWSDRNQPENRQQLGLLKNRSLSIYPAYPNPWPGTTALEFVIETKNQEIWFGDQEGIGMIQEQAITRFDQDNDLPPDRASAFLELDNGLIWAALGSSIFEYDGKRWRSLFSAQGRINAILQASDKSIWVASNTGLHRYHYDSWVTINAQDGLPGNTVYSVAEDDRGQIWIGTTRGIHRFYPEADTDPPRSQIQVLASAPRNLSSNARHAVFVARDRWDFTPKNRLLFSYRLDERPWTPYTSRDEITLENLSAGRHRLEVRAMDRNWNEEDVAADYEFMWVIPWHDDPRLVIISAIGFGVIALLVGLVINRHIRLTRSYAEVERIVALRTAELEAANQELLQTQKMRALGTLSAGIAHDFNGILSIIRGSAQIIETNLNDEEKVRTRLERIRLVVDQGAGVIRAMLGLARSGEKHLRDTDINEIVSTTLQLMDDRLPKTIQVKFSRESEHLPSVRIVVDLLQQSLINLLSNASDAMSGQGEIRVSTGGTTDLPADLALKPGPGETYNWIAIQDSGYGIAEEVLPRIFEPFFTSKAFSSKRGTGLGLSMVYEMAKELKAGIAVQSKANQGTRFTLFIPVIPERRDSPS